MMRLTHATQSSDARRRFQAIVVIVSLVGVSLVGGWTGATSGIRPVVHARSADVWLVARSHRPLGIPLPDGTTLLLRREYRAFYRALAVSQDGLVLGKAYHAARPSREAGHTDA